ncbi:MAG TPA: hypothetical protein V6D12_17800 [Candidatus Obscuribacterales bacterium]
MGSNQEQIVKPTERVDPPGQVAPVVKPSFLAEVAKRVAQIGTAVGSRGSQSGKAIATRTLGVGKAAGKQTQRLIEQATQRAGNSVSFISDNWLLRKVSGVLRLDWVVGATNRVDLQKAQADVKKLQQEHPGETPSQISHRLMVEKSMYAGGVGLVSSLVPGQALALLAVDFAATSALQAEMVYQIAAAYGLDLQDPARKGEVLGIFGLALGGSRAVKAGLGLLRNVPFAGAAIGASSNAVMLYSLGYAACRFYEAKLNASTSEATLTDIKEGSEEYLEKAIAQQAVMDRVLVHLILASYPQKSWEQILPDLQTLNLSPASLEAIAANIQSPQPMDTLLNQLNRDYAVPLLAQCYRIAQLDGMTTPEEASAIEQIATKFDIDLNAIKQAVDAVA